MRVWDRYSATVWQLGDRVGVTWDERPTWTDGLLDDLGRPKCPTPKQSEWEFPPDTAGAYFDQLAGNLREMGSDR